MAADTRAPNKRRAPRVPASGEVWIGEAGVFSKTMAQVRNLSRHGLFIATTEGLYGLDSILNIGFSIPGDDERVFATVIVRHAQSDGVGLEFLEITDRDRERIETLIGTQSVPPWWQSEGP